MNPNALKAKLESLAPNTTAVVTDTTGTEDHFEAVIVSPAFEGKIRIERHRLVMSLLDKEMKTGDIHALTMKTWTPEEQTSKGTK